MIIVRLLGGLGNQMFQYATGRALAARRGAPLKLDLSAFRVYPLRSYRLDNFRIAATLAEASDVAGVRGTDRGPLRRRIQAAVERRRPYYRRRMVQEPHYHFDPNLRRVGRNAYLVGFWQSEKYFGDIRDALLAELSVAEPPDPANRRVLERIDATDSISLHVRRGDYVSDPNNQRIYAACSPRYYRDALDTILPRLGEPHVFVFSDDITWAKEHLRFPCPTTFVDHNGAERDYEDMRLMSRCRHHVIANSSFSWWGAWLARDPAKQVVAPLLWFNDPAVDTRDVIPASWLRL
jgi:hypothetical protein